MFPYQFKAADSKCSPSLVLPYFFQKPGGKENEMIKLRKLNVNIKYQIGLSFALIF